MQSFALALRAEFDGTGVTVTTLMPGPTETEFFERAGMEDTRIGQMDKDDAADVAFPGADGQVETVAESLAFWPFTHEELADDLHAAGLAIAASAYAPGVERYLVTTRRSAGGAGAG